ncbi:hypothetical protein FisN_7Lh247 [Fistulifera solaris]|uniref:DUF6816 domain-containing protein n=1 Tax=Fistulifera solaris TaxID=1519565 RepID=A0A1Z5JR76_FISSO|nr:hypothetical protein FisN_7Lh247 [Fistulifera solaris]|eukprot:GAX16524.1 hypothetical protein FisN_7Lh247 [Fistulifera solaris]
MRRSRNLSSVFVLITLLQRQLAFEFRDSLSRRSLFHEGCAVAALCPQFAVAATTEKPLLPGGKAPRNIQMNGEWNDMPLLQTKLAQSRIGQLDFSPLQQPLLGANELYYAPFLFGSWNTTATLKRKIYPFGLDYVPSNSLIEGSPRYREETVGDRCSYEVHYFATIANTVANQATVNLGLGIPETKIIQDRAFNAMSLSTAYNQLSPVTDVVWDYRNDPTKVLLALSSLSADMRPLGPRRAEIFLQARQVESLGGDVFCSAEKSRAVTIAGRDVVVSETETITEFRKVDRDHVSAISRIAVYLTPNPNSREGILWQQTEGKAIAFFDYELEMQRLKEDVPMANGRAKQRACVRTPKDVIQCD